MLAPPANSPASASRVVKGVDAPTLGIGAASACTCAVTAGSKSRSKRKIEWKIEVMIEGRERGFKENLIADRRDGAFRISFSPQRSLSSSPTMKRVISF